MGTASSECQEKLRRVVKGLEGVEQIQDDVMVHRKGEAHDRNLEICLQRLEEKGFTLRTEKCQFGKSSVLWFGHIFSEEGMSPDPKKVPHFKEWQTTESKAEVKSFLQTVQFCACFMKPKRGHIYRFDQTTKKTYH